MVEAATQNLPAATGKPIKGYVPAKEKPEHIAMYEFYRKLGKNRSLRKVAREFSKSLPFISNLSRAFGWQNRVKGSEPVEIDPVVNDTRVDVNDSRRKLARVVGNIADTLNEMATLATNIKDKNAGILSDSETRKSMTLIKSLEVFGIKIRTPKDMRDLVSILKEITSFNLTPDAPHQPKTQNTQFNVEEMNLVIKDLD